MKTILISVMVVIALLLTGCDLFEDKEKAGQIIRLQTALDSQQGIRAAELQFGERQASFYLGCKAFFNRCSRETTELGQKLLQSGFTGNTSIWYWAGLFGELLCIAAAVAVLINLFLHLHLTIITPKKEEVLRAQRLVDGVNEYAAEGKIWRAAHEKKMLKEKSELAKMVAEKKEKAKERDRLYQSVLDAYAELASVQSQLKEAGKRKASTQFSEDF